jgi:tRNA(Ser,Leu) C12 N-acetylase TAN1
MESDLQEVSHESSAFNRARTSVVIGAKMTDKHESKTKKFMAAPEKRDFNHLDDFLFTVAESIEEAFLRAGAQPDKDYHYRDLFKTAVDLDEPDVTVVAEVLGPVTVVGVLRKSWQANSSERPGKTRGEHEKSATDAATANPIAQTAP